MEMTRVQITVRGIVQGVGFRPFVFWLARRRLLRGQVLNNSTGVLIDIEGEADAITGFIDDMKSNPPPLSMIESVECTSHPEPANYIDFRIVESASDGEKLIPISPDVATCEDCLKELFDPSNRRYRYPFINCTNCGPRFTIIEDVPYDRAKTTMSGFPMCAECRSEYNDPSDRRFHAQPNACPSCGPRIYKLDRFGNAIHFPEKDAVAAALSRIERGEIVAIKGLGGFHLACDALNVEAVSALRKRKYREDKPFALMAGEISAIRNFCQVSPEEERLLRSPGRPIVLLAKKKGCSIPEVVAPNLRYIGFMLPYTPLHHLLIGQYDSPMVMTSGNTSDEPIAYRDEDAIERLGAIADSFLMHNREIYIRCDDSVTRSFKGREYPIRRSRGYVPYPIKLSIPFENEILACGAELKNTFCLTRDNYAFLSHHIGDLENLETLESFREGIEHAKRLFYLEPEVVAYDLHPEYLSTKYALAIDDIPLKIGVQHHHAHIVSCMAENNLEGEVIGVAMDGLGYGTDGCLWGSEFLIARFADYERMYHLEYVPMPGGGKAIKEPWRMAAVYLHRAYGDAFLGLDLPFVEELDVRAWHILERMITQGINSPETCGMGRLFDAVSSLIGLRKAVNYEGEAAVELEMIAHESTEGCYRFEITADTPSVGANQVIRDIVNDLGKGTPVRVISGKFHRAVAHMIANVSRRIREERGLNRVVLSGGVFQNMLLLGLACEGLESDEFEVYVHHRVPANDGGISLGQAVVADARCMIGSGIIEIRR